MDNSFIEKINNRIDESQSLLCVGLDPSIDLIKKYNFKDMFSYNKEIIDATYKYALCYKPQIAYYSAYKEEESLEKTINYIHKNYSNIPVILDAKRGDIDSTASMYALESFKRYNVDAVTLNAYLGLDGLQPFYLHKDKGKIIVVRTSNPGANDFQEQILQNGQKLYQYIADKILEKYGIENTLFVVGGTAIESMSYLRNKYPNIYFLVPGIGHQGGDLELVIKNGITSNKKGLIINVSRGISNIIDSDFFDDYIRRVECRAKDWYEKIYNKLIY